MFSFQMAVRVLCVGLCVYLGLSGPALRAEPLKSAKVSRIYNDVKLLPEDQPARAAAVSDTVSGKAAVQTGAASRTELTFSDQTLTRLGANSYFSFVNGTRNMNLGSGTMLLQVPKGAGGAEIHTAAVTAAITGTTLLVEYNPKRYSKIIVLEGTVRVSLTGRLGESILVHAGQMVIVPPASKTLPEPVGVDLKMLYATSGLVNDFSALASNKLIDREITRQKKEIDGGKLTNTNLFIVGRGTEVQEGHLTYVVGNDQAITARQGPDNPLLLGETRRPFPPPVPVETPTPTLLPLPTPTVRPSVPPTPTPEPTRTPLPTPTVTPIPTVRPTPTPVPTVTPPPTPTPVPTVTPPTTPTPSPTVSPTPSPTVTPTPTPSVSPTPTPSPTVTPTPTPTVSPTPTPNSKNGPLPLIANNAAGNGTSYGINTSTVIRTDPFITTAGVEDSGRIYRGGVPGNPSGAGSPDGLPSNYLLGATLGPSVFDGQIGFDNQFGTIGEIGAFKFSNLALLGNPADISTANGPTNLALIAVGTIKDSTGANTPTGPTGPLSFGSTFDLRGLDNVLLATQGGTITFGGILTFQNSGATATALTLYARGGALNLGASTTFTLPGSALNLYSDTDLTMNGVVGSSTAAGAGAGNLISGGALTVGGLLHTSGDLAATTTVQGGGAMALNSNSTLLSESSLTLNSGGTLDASGTMIAYGSLSLTSVGNLGVTGSGSAGGASAGVPGGAGDPISLNSAANLSVLGSGTLSANGNNFDAANGNSAAISGGAGGRIVLDAGADLTLRGGASSGTNGQLVTISARGGDALNADVSPGGVGGTINLRAGGVIDVESATLDVRSGSNNQVGATPDDAPGGTINVTSRNASAPDVTTIRVLGATLLADNGVAGSSQQGTGGTINFASLDASATSTTNAAVVISGSTLRVSREEVTSSPPPINYGSRVGGTITISSARTAGPGISVQDSSQLLALVNSRSTDANSGGTITVTTRGADIAVNNSTVRATGNGSAVNVSTGTGGGTVTVNGSRLSTATASGAILPGSTVSLRTQNTAAAQASAINLTNANLVADILKVQALGTNGHLTIGGSSQLSSNTQLILYGGSGANGIINFTGNTTLDAGTTVAGILAARTMQISGRSTVVTVNGSASLPLQVYADNRNFYLPGAAGPTGDYGTFAGNAAPTEADIHPYGDAPTPAPATVAANGQAATSAVGKTAGHSRVPTNARPVSPTTNGPVAGVVGRPSAQTPPVRPSTLHPPRTIVLPGVAAWRERAPR